LKIECKKKGGENHLLYHFLSTEQLKEAETNKLVPRFLLTEALLERLKHHEHPEPTNNNLNSVQVTIPSMQSSSFAPSSPPASSSSVMTTTKINEQQRQQQQTTTTLPLETDESEETLRMIPRVEYAILLDFSHDFDENGVLYHIGTKAYMQPWKNPATRGLVRVTSSSVEKGSVIFVLDRQPKEFWTMDVPASWIQSR
jgi:hypothetical protein